MSTKYKATTTEEAFFITMTTVGWIGVFTMLNSDGANTRWRGFVNPDPPDRADLSTA